MYNSQELRNACPCACAPLNSVGRDGLIWACSLVGTFGGVLLLGALGVAMGEILVTGFIWRVLTKFSIVDLSESICARIPETSLSSALKHSDASISLGSVFGKNGGVIKARLSGTVCRDSVELWEASSSPYLPILGSAFAIFGP